MSELLEASLKTLTGTIDNIEARLRGMGGIEANNKSVLKEIDYSNYRLFRVLVNRLGLEPRTN